MQINISNDVQKLLSDPKKLLMKKPFTRGAVMNKRVMQPNKHINIGGMAEVQLPRYERNIIGQEQYLFELDPNCHDVLFDENIPSICVKLKNGSFREIKTERVAVAFQQQIKDKQVLHLTGNDFVFTLLLDDPTDEQVKRFATFKKYWDMRNQHGMFVKMVDTAKSVGDAGLLYYYDNNGCVKSRLISFKDGYVIVPHDDQNGDRILESIYYCDEEGNEHIDSYDTEYHYHMYRAVIDVENANQNGWVYDEPKKHGFDEIPLITHRTTVAWENGVHDIAMFEEMYNVFLSIEKRNGWGILYVRGKYSDKGKKLAGNIVINDTSVDGNGDAKYLTAPTPDNMIKTLDKQWETIQINCSTTFILPKDISISGDVSGIAVQLTQAMDLECANRGAIEWQNVVNKMMRLFRCGLSHELVNKGEDKEAVTQYPSLLIGAKTKVWRPTSIYEYNQMLGAMKSQGLISQETAVENNTESKPDELSRLDREYEKQLERDLDKEEKQADIKSKYASTTSSSGGSNKQTDGADLNSNEPQIAAVPKVDNSKNAI